MNCQICVGVEIFAWEGVKELFQALVTNRFLAFNELLFCFFKTKNPGKNGFSSQTIYESNFHNNSASDPMWEKRHYTVHT